MILKPLPPKTLRENALRLLEAGQSALQIATLLNVPIGKIYYWHRYYMNPHAPLSDGRRLYDDPFKRAVMEQLAAGISVVKLAQSLEVSKVTLFKWKREGRQAQNGAKDALEVVVPLEGKGGDESAGEAAILPQPTIADLVVRIRALEEEQELLKQALRRLMYPV